MKVAICRIKRGEEGGSKSSEPTQKVVSSREVSFNKETSYVSQDGPSTVKSWKKTNLRREERNGRKEGGCRWRSACRFAQLDFLLGPAKKEAELQGP